MTDSKFCEHGVNVGLKNPPVFCGQCPPDTIATLRADLAKAQSEARTHEGSARALQGHIRHANETHEREVAVLRADLARVTEERDEARAKVTALTLTGATLDLTLAVLRRLRATRQREGADTPRTEAALTELTRYAEALGGGK